MLTWLARSGSLRALCFAGLVSSVTVTLIGCAPPLTAADVEELGTRSYAGTTRGQAFRATVAAVRSLGYETALVEEGAGRLKTAPKLLVVHASGGAYGARAVGSSLAWDIDVTAANGSAVISARPRGYEGGQSLPISRMNGGYMKRTYETLFTEIESNLPASVRHARVDDAR